MAFTFGHAGPWRQPQELVGASGPKSHTLGRPTPSCALAQPPLGPELPEVGQCYQEPCTGCMCARVSVCVLTQSTHTHMCLPHRPMLMKTHTSTTEPPPLWLSRCEWRAQSGRRVSPAVGGELALARLSCPSSCPVPLGSLGYGAGFSPPQVSGGGLAWTVPDGDWASGQDPGANPRVKVSECSPRGAGKPTLRCHHGGHQGHRAFTYRSVCRGLGGVWWAGSDFTCCLPAALWSYLGEPWGTVGRLGFLFSAP